MNKIKLTKDKLFISLIIILSAILNIFNLGIEGYANQYYAAGVKSMTMSLKNFFFVSFDPAGFVSIDKPPVGFWLQAISAKIFGYHGWSIILPQALAGVLSVFVIYKLVKRSFGANTGLLSALFLAVTPVFVAVSRNNTIDNTLILVLLLACYALSVAADNGKFKYLFLSMILIGIGFNVKMLQAYMIIPAIYITYLLSNNISIKRRIINLIAGTAVLVMVSLSWALIVDRVAPANRPFVDSSTNNTVMELILGHNGAERLSLSSGSSKSGNFSGGPAGQMPPNFSRSDSKNGASNGSNNNNGNINGNSNYNVVNNNINSNNFGNPPSGQNMQGSNPPGNGMNGNDQGGYSKVAQNKDFKRGSMGGNFWGGRHGGAFHGMRGGAMRGGRGGNSVLSGSFGADTKSGITRLFSKNILSDQIIWFFPLAFIGFIGAAIKEKMSYKLNNKKLKALSLWFMWLLPVFIYFSFNTGLFHGYYLTMLAPPIAALAAIGVTSMWEMYKEGGVMGWFLPIALLANAAVQLLMISYFYNTSNIVKALLIVVILLSVIPSIVLGLMNLVRKKTVNGDEDNKIIKLKKLITAVAVAGLIASPFTGSAATLSNQVNGSMPSAGLELLSSNSFTGMDDNNSNSDSGLITYLQKHKTNEKYLLVVSSIGTAENIIINTGESVMTLGGFLGTDKIITLTEFKELVKKGEVRYVLVDGMGGRGNNSNDIMSWAAKYGKLVSSNEYSSSTSNNNNQNFRGFGGNSGQLYDLKALQGK